MEEQPPEHYSRSEVENVKVAVRCRPLSGLERQQGHRQIVQIDGQTQAILVANPHSPNEPEKHYAFDAIFGPDSSQSYVYNSIARPIVDNVLKGFNGTIFAYGQTGTGKTFTMSGDPDSNENGIIQFSFAQIFDHIVKSGHEKRFLVRISYMEIYNEEVRDLLARHSNSTSTTSQSQPRSLEIKERQDIGVYVKDLLNVTVSNADQCMRIMHFGNSNRHTGKTAMNEQSSRSHAIFTITIECSETFVDGRQLLTQGKLSFVDLAGSERQSKTNAVGEQLREATKINLSLSTLGNVISALAEAKSQHIPYRNSKLTRILQDSLGGNSKTCMIANIGPASYNYEETVSTLRYASRAKRIQNVARINEDPKDALLRRFQEEIEQLKRALEDVEPESDAENKSDDEKHHIVVLSATDEAHKQQENLKATKKEGNVDAHDASASNIQNAAERRRLAEDLLRRNEELKRNKLEREKLTQKLMTIERQIIVGGENMLEKAELQAQLLDESNQDLEQARQNEQTLHERFRNQQAEHLDIEERNSSMQEQAHGLGKKLKKVWVQYMQTKQELHDQEMEHNRETETLLETIRQLEREFAFSSLVIDQFVPVKQQRFIERHTHWNEEIGDWQLRCIAYTGNNIREDHRLYNPHYKATDPQLMPLFLNYADFMEPSMGNNSSHPDSASSSTSSHTSKARIKEAARIQALLE